MKISEIEEIKEYTGKIYDQFLQGKCTVLLAEKGKFFLSNRSNNLSDISAIKKVSDYGLSPVFWVGDSQILQSFVEFNSAPLNLSELTLLMKKIHSNQKGGLALIHGDFSRWNTVKYSEKAKCFDYEYCNWGNLYVDLGRVILRECKSEKEANLLLENYFGYTPKVEDLREGLITFCQRQYEMRHEKNQSFQEIPKLRIERLLKSNLKIEEILRAFKEEIKI